MIHTTRSHTHTHKHRIRRSKCARERHLCPQRAPAMGQCDHESSRMAILDESIAMEAARGRTGGGCRKRQPEPWQRSRLTCSLLCSPLSCCSLSCCPRSCCPLPCSPLTCTPGRASRLTCMTGSSRPTNRRRGAPPVACPGGGRAEAAFFVPRTSGAAWLLSIVCIHHNPR